ncbi:MAG: chemotaxis protein CheA [Adhaeribacter sp.]
MKSREQEYKEIFIAEALEYFDSLNRHLSELEKDPTNDDLLAEVFRLLHNMKANAKAIGYLQIADIAHKLETAFELIRNRELAFSDDIVAILFDGIDLLGDLIANVDNQEFKIPDESVIRNLDMVMENGHDKGGNGDRALEVARSPKFTNAKSISLSDLVYIQIKKLDHLLNLVGELIIDRDRILSISKELEHPDLTAVSSHLYRITEDLQYSVMDARLVTIGSLFNKFPRIVRDIALAEKKDIHLEISGQDIQIDRNILQIITDSLLHIMRNAISHGIEPAEVREKVGKTREGNISLGAQSDREMVQIHLRDDGKGIDMEDVRRGIIQRGFLPAEVARDLRDSEALSYIFEPGFSLAKEVTEVSGRGVGLDVVKNAIDAIGGKIRVESEKGKGTTFTLHLPTSIAVKGALLFEVDGNFYAIPLMHTDSVVAWETSELHEVGDLLVADIKGETITVISLNEFLTADPTAMDLGSKHKLKGLVQNIIIVTYNNRKLGLIVDKLYRQQDIVIKPLNKPVDNLDIYGGVTLLGSGKVCLVLDVPGITRYFLNRKID